MSFQHVPVHHSESMEEILEDPFDDELESTFPPQRYCATYYPRPQQGATKLRRESSIERSRLYRELVGHEPYRPPAPRAQKNAKNDFRVLLSVKHYTPEEITLKVDGQKLYVTGKHHQELESGFDKSEFQRVYVIPEQIDMRTLTSTITLDGVLIIKAIAKQADQNNAVNSEEFAVLPANEDGDKFKVTLDVSEYKPSEISIHVNERYLVVTAERKEERVDEHGAIAHHKRYERKFSLSAEVNSEFLSSRYRDGKITIEAPRKEVNNEMRKLEIQEEKE